MRAAARKAVDVGHEAGRLGALTVEAEIAHNTLAIAARVRCEMALGCTPRLESPLIEFDTPVLLQEATQRVDDPFLMDITAPKRALSLQIPVDRPVECAP